MFVNMPPSIEQTFARHQRQVHLDFHNSPLIPDVARAFDADAFARTFEEAHVNSVTVAAKCHHGMCYYPAQTGTPHPALAGRDLLGEQIEALHRRGLRAPVYTTIGWEEEAARLRPDWRQLRADGTPAMSTDVGPWNFLNFLHADYQDYVEAHLRELCARYGAAIDGVFLDILNFHGEACWSEPSLRFRDKHGLAADGAGAHQRFQAAAQAAFAQRFTPLLRGLLPASATVFYNASNDVSLDAAVGPRSRYPLMTHAEIESLPTGAWGYQHFPRVARALAHWGKPWLGMTGRFLKAWGDFGGVKPRAALEYECFRTQALGGANSVGDQLHPGGRLDPDSYVLIGKVYAQCKQAEGFYAGSHALPNFGNLCASYPGLDPAETVKTDEGAMLMAAEMHRDVAMLDESADLADFALIQLPDTVVITPPLARKLRAYYEDGGKLLLSYRSGFDPAGRWALDFLPYEINHPQHDVALYPTYWRARPDMVAAMGRSDRVCYLPGVEVKALAGTRVLVERVLPYFRRTEENFSSHLYVPPAPEADAAPAVIAGERFVYFADPIFREFRQAGNLMMRDTWHAAMNGLIGEPPFGDGLPRTMEIVPRRRGSRPPADVVALHSVPHGAGHGHDRGAFELCGRAAAPARAGEDRPGLWWGQPREGRGRSVRVAGGQGSVVAGGAGVLRNVMPPPVVGSLVSFGFGRDRCQHSNEHHSKITTL